MKNLKNILSQVQYNQIIGDADIDFNAIQYDSRKVNKNDVFVAIKGVQADGHKFVDKAIQQGAIAVVVEEKQDDIPENIAQIIVDDSHIALAELANAFYDFPSTKLNLIGITGTNGKTTTATLSYLMFKDLGYKTGLISTVKIMINDKAYPATHTTPDPLVINQYLSQMLDEGVEYVFMEVSSHGIDQKRVQNLNFKGGIFTNLTHDHLDYHKNFINYRDVKKQFFDNLDKNAFALVNIDDRNGMFMLQNTKAQKYTYALKNPADFKVKILEQNFSGMLLRIDEKEVWVKLIGQFNAYNILAVYAIGVLSGLDQFEVLQSLSNLNSVDGRFEILLSSTGKVAIVDYAHTPDALENVLKTINSIRPNNTETLITIVGAGGNRDKTKRPEMAEVAVKYSNKVIFTSDNPRNENPDDIIDEMEAGVPGEYFKKTLRITDRRQAIRVGVQLANAGDIILIAGKGHEDYQIIGNEKIHFDDREEVKTAFEKEI